MVTSAVRVGPVRDRLAVRVVARGLSRIGVLRGPVRKSIDKEAYRPWFMHGTSHWLGLDVHDAGEYRRAGAWRALEPGMTLTVEPGLYIRSADDVPAALRDIGIRIEDDVAVTRGGCEVLSADAPKAPAEIEALMAGSR